MWFKMILLSFSIFSRWDDTFYAAGISIAISGLLAYVIGTLRPVDDDDDDDDDESCSNE
jgi:hypothetical protein